MPDDPRTAHYVAPIEDATVTVDAVRIGEKPSNLWTDAWRDIRRRPTFWLSLVIALAVLLMAVWPTLFTGTPPDRNCLLDNSNAGSRPGHPLGFTFQGCDIYARIVWGARTSVSVGVLATVISSTLGLVMGAWAGFYGGWLDSLLSRVGDIFFSIPYILAAVVVMTAFSQYRNVFFLALAIGGFAWAATARVVRAEVLRVRQSDYITAARAIGRSRLRTMLTHAIPNAIAPLLVITTLSLAGAIVAEATLAFLGVGVGGDTMSWGKDISQAQASIRVAPMALIYPSIALTVTVLAFITLGELIRDGLDPESEGAALTTSKEPLFDNAGSEPVTTEGGAARRSDHDGEPLLTVRDLKVAFRTQRGLREVLHGVNLDLYPGETLALVGESGSGKSTMATAIIQLLPSNGLITGGSIKLRGRELTTLSRSQMSRLRGRDVGYVPQDPMSNLNPVWSIGFQVREAIRANGIAKGRKAINARAVEVLQQAGLADAERRMRQYPHQFSGGMRQRALISMGLAADPPLLIADEPTSALDVTVQRVILDHMASLAEEKGTAVLLITHDLGLAAERAERIVVMQHGSVVESGPSRTILTDPVHPYTQKLVAAAPSIASQRIQVQERHHDDAGVEKRPAEPLVRVRELVKDYRIRTRGFASVPLRAVDHATFDIPRGSTLALVGESGSGKSTVAKLLLKIEEPTSGSIEIGGTNIADLSESQMLALRRRMQPVFQDPYGSLDPLLRNIGNSIAEPLAVHKVGDKRSRHERVRELLDQVALPQELINRYPNELSGGQRQRVAIARALALKPDVVVLDEAVSALDVLVQDQILRLLAELQEELGLTYLFITHDLAVVRMVADHVCVMEQGRIVEQGSVTEIFDHPQENYTRTLLDAIPGASIPLGAGPA